MFVGLLGYLGHACVFEMEVNLALKVLVFVAQVLDVEVRLVKESGKSVTVSGQLGMFITTSRSRLNLDYLLILNLKLILKTMRHF
jgi:hypothetical protein